MSETEEVNTTTETAVAPKKKGKLFMIIGLVIVLMAGGGVGYYFWNKSKVEAAALENGEAGEEASKEETVKPKKSKQKKVVEEDEEEKPTKNNAMRDALPDDEDVKSVVEIPPFIVNLADTESPRYLRMSVSLGVGEGEHGEEKPSPLFLTRVKNAMLAVLANKTSDEILSLEGKSKLRKELLKAARAASEEPHVEALYITDFIVQL